MNQNSETIITEDKVIEKQQSYKIQFTLFLIFALLTVIMNYYLSTFENSGGTLKIHWLIAKAYNLGGKWFVTFCLGALSGFFLFLTIRKLLRNRHKRQF